MYTECSNHTNHSRTIRKYQKIHCENSMRISPGPRPIHSLLQCMKSIAMCASLLHFWKFEIGAQWQATIILQYNVYYRLCIYRVSPSQRMSQKTLYVCGNRFSTKLRRRVIFDLFLYRGIPTGPSITAINIVRLYPFFF